ncbi:MAG TPA: MBOAT family O-acyltransferase [Oscillospiraceae bacterium]|nr:MBOAT family O-acyltransferase [Oscillospiraceae bacterium]HRW56573.1 MBOAT family O-acyltransferase [Oscillospiraceae bacterium]
MVFSSLLFLYAFLPINLVLYFLTKKREIRNAVLILFSLIFYSWGEPVWVTLLIFSATIDYFHGLIIERHRHDIGAKLAVLSSLILNLSLLGIFKYSGFIVENINALAGLSLPVPSFSLPIGISFYTFQTISYVIDVYRGQVEPQHNYAKFFMYVSLYSQLVAGPIVRYADVAREVNYREENLHDVSAGISRFLIGLTKKVLIANTAGAFAEEYLSGDLTQSTTAAVWFGVLMFSLQIYYDFSGYSDMAIGLGWIFGFHFLENFNYPYIAKSATDFWRRWHMSLGQFFRDYVYIPMGGNRKHQYFNLFIVWFLTGLWHGASWNFILWGLWFGLLIMVERLFLRKVLDKLPAVVGHLYLLLAAVLGWVLFYFTDLGKAWDCLRVMFGAAGTGFWDITLEITLENNLFWLIAAVAFCMPIYPRVRAFIENRPALANVAGWLKTPANLLMLATNTALLVGSSYNPFLYYRF